MPTAKPSSATGESGLDCKNDKGAEDGKRPKKNAEKEEKEHVELDDPVSEGDNDGDGNDDGGGGDGDGDGGFTAVYGSSAPSSSLHPPAVAAAVATAAAAMQGMRQIQQQQQTLQQRQDEARLRQVELHMIEQQRRRQQQGQQQQNARGVLLPTSRNYTPILPTGGSAAVASAAAASASAAPKRKRKPGRPRKDGSTGPRPGPKNPRGKRTAMPPPRRAPSLVPEAPGAPPGGAEGGDGPAQQQRARTLLSQTSEGRSWLGQLDSMICHVNDLYDRARVSNFFEGRVRQMGRVPALRGRRLRRGRYRKRNKRRRGNDDDVEDGGNDGSVDGDGGRSGAEDEGEEEQAREPGNDGGGDRDSNGEEEEDGGGGGERAVNDKTTYCRNGAARVPTPHVASNMNVWIKDQRLLWQGLCKSPSGIDAYLFGGTDGFGIADRSSSQEGSLPTFAAAASAATSANAAGAVAVGVHGTGAVPVHAPSPSAQESSASAAAPAPAPAPSDAAANQLRNDRAKLFLLRSAGFIFDPAHPPPPKPTAGTHDDWSSYYLDLREHARTRGHTYVPTCTELGLWADLQRRRYRRGLSVGTRVDRNRTVALVAIGFDFTEEASELCNWDLMAEKLDGFREEFGDCLVPTPGDGLDLDGMAEVRVRYRGLGRWVQMQRIEHAFYKASSSSSSTNGTTRVHGDGTASGAGGEEGSQPQQANGDTSAEATTAAATSTSSSANQTALISAQVDRLDKLDFVWITTIKPLWIRQYRRLQAFRKAHGHCKISKGTVPLDLYKWAANVRTCHRRYKENGDQPVKRGKGLGSGSLDAEKIKLLESIDFVFEFEDLPPVIGWEQRYQWLVEFKQEHGHCLVPQRHPLLGEFVKKMRQAYEYKMQGVRSRTKMSDERVEKLEALGFQWRIRPSRIPSKKVAQKRKREESGKGGSDDEVYENAREHEGVNEDEESDGGEEEEEEEEDEGIAPAAIV